jgi:hypothetical protein
MQRNGTLRPPLAVHRPETLGLTVHGAPLCSTFVSSRGEPVNNSVRYVRDDLQTIQVVVPQGLAVFLL